MSTRAVRWEGKERLMRSLARIPQELRKDKLEAALVEAAEPLRDAMAALAPRSAGPGHGYRTNRHIADSITIEPAAASGMAKVRVGPGGGDPGEFFYDTFLEFGTRTLKARPFIRPAYDQARDQVLAALERTVVDAVEVAARG